MSSSSVRDRLAPILEKDAAIILLTLFPIYVVFAAVGTILGYPIGGMVNLIQRVTFLTAVYALVVLALNLQWGLAGLFNIGIAGFMAVGAYAMAILTAPPGASPGGFGLPLAVGIAGGLVVAAVLGLITALPALRLRADYLAITTVAISEIVRLGLNSQAAVPYTGGASGMSDYTQPTVITDGLFLRNPNQVGSEPTALGETVFTFFENTFNIYSSATILGIAYVVFLIFVVVLVYLLIARLVKSPFGRVLKGIREDEEATQSLGKDTRLFKIKTFMVGCALMGLAGMLWMGSEPPVNPARFRPVLTFYIFIALIIGGAGSNTGSVIGGAVFANVLFFLPTLLENVVNTLFSLQASPNNSVEAFGPLLSGQVEPLLGYIIGNIPPLRFVLIGVLLILLIQRRPDGILGHRTETASSVSLTASTRPSRSDGGEDDE